MEKVDVKIELTIRFYNSFFIGGGRSIGGVQAYLLRDAHDLPCIPASSIKGCIAQSAQVLSDNYAYGKYLKLLFGEEGVRHGMLHFSDGEMMNRKQYDGNHLYLIDHKTGIKINRHTKTKSEKHFYTRETSGQGGMMEYKSHIQGFLPKEDYPSITTFLLAAIRFLFAIGGGRSSGLGWLDEPICCKCFINGEEQSQEMIEGWRNAGEPFADEGATEPSVCVEGQSEDGGASDRFNPLQKDNQYITVEATLLSPLMVGGRTLKSNYRESKPYIPGNVLRAAYARAIIERCPYSHPNYWLTYKGMEGCQKCGCRGVCRNFADIWFPTLYPLGARPYPATAKEEKYVVRGDANQKTPKDIVKWRIAKGSVRHGDESKWERLEGFHKNGEKIGVVPMLISRTAIDYRRRSSKRGALYSQNAIVGVMVGEEEKTEGVTFVGLMPVNEMVGEGMMTIGELRIGAGLTSGMGRCAMRYAEAEAPDTREQLEKRVEEFNLNIDDERRYITVDLLTDAYLKQEEIKGDEVKPFEIADADFCKYLQEQIGLPKAFTLERAYKSQEAVRGYDTAKGSEAEMRRDGRLVVKAGAVFLFSILKDNDYDVDALLSKEMEGIGCYREHGFGRVRICDLFHMEYDILDGNKKGEE